MMNIRVRRAAPTGEWLWLPLVSWSLFYFSYSDNVCWQMSFTACANNLYSVELRTIFVYCATIYGLIYVIVTTVSTGW